MRTPWTPWHEVVQLRDDIKLGELSLSLFAADLYDVVMQKGQSRVYECPAEFFALTYPTLRLKELAKDVVLRLAGRSDKAYRKLSVTYGGGKTHTLIALRHLVYNPWDLPDLSSVQEFEAHVGFKSPRARVAALCCDKIDPEKGVETLGPHGEIRTLKCPWSLLAYQLAGDEGLRYIHGEGCAKERDTPPAEPLLVDLLSWPQAEGLSTLVLLDEVLMYVRTKVEADERWRGRLVNFFQHLCQAATKVDKCAMVASLLASEPRASDALGKELLGDISDVFGRQTEEDASPVGKEDVAEVLRRRFFTPESIREPNRFRPHVTIAVGNIADLDKQTEKARGATEGRYLTSYPFHPDLTEIFYARWTQLDGFQKTRGILRTFAVALRDAARWDGNPLVGTNVFLVEPGAQGLAEAASELVNIASIDTGEGQHQEWKPILEGELSKARDIQSESTGLRCREMEQAVMSVFLNSQPTGHKATTQELFVLLGMTRPDRIELEKALHRWIELSWFLDETESERSDAVSGDSRRLPVAWRLGNRPNLRQMHHDACTHRVPTEWVESQVQEVVEKSKAALTSRASATGARVHFLPRSPRDVGDDGEFRFAILGPEAVSEVGRPSAEAQRYINETTSPDHPRVHRNAIVLAVPSRDELGGLRTRVREHLGWQEVENQLKDQAVDPIRQQRLADFAKAAREHIPASVRQAYSIVVTVNTYNAIHAFKVVTSKESLFLTIKADRRARMEETAISAEALLPDGPYDLWREDEKTRRVKDLVDAFSQSPKLPKMLQRQGILDTIMQGVMAGIWVAQVPRPDKSLRTFWRTGMDATVFQESELALVLPKDATLGEVDPRLLAPRALPGLWNGESTGVRDVLAYFAGGHKVIIPREGYDDVAVIPKCDPVEVERAIAQAVEQGRVWLTHGPASLLEEPVPPDILNPAAVLRQPPESIGVDEIMAETIPNAWQNGKTDAEAIATTLSDRRGVNLPWSTVRSAIDDGIRAGWIEVDEGGARWPCDFQKARHVVLQIPEKKVKSRGDRLLVGEAVLEPHGIQDLAEQIPDLTHIAVGTNLKFCIRIELGGKTRPKQEVIDKLNELLAEVSDELILK